MKFQNVCIDDIAWVIPDNAVSTLSLEQKMAPAYARLGMTVGQLQALTGQQERRFWEPGTPPSHGAIQACSQILHRHEGIRENLGLLINSSVCRDQLEPATATIVGKGLELSRKTMVFDVSNACLGFVTAMTIAAQMIESSQIRHALIVSSEGGLEVVENAIHQILQSPDEKTFMESIPTLTLGSAAVAMLLSHRSVARRPLRFVAGATLNDVRHSHLCLWGPDTGFPSKLHHSMRTDGKTVLETGTKLAQETWDEFSRESQINPDELSAIFCHQVGPIHTQAVYRILGLNPALDFATFETYGNTGSAALPLTLGMGIEAGVFGPSQKAAMLGIGSGLVCTMFSLEWDG